ncbi:Dyp-type peroxidase [Sneathiella marina]|uniref:Dyp-type peroxidase n=1 Tax=Sneathiella marina TaxID=2950108 RepID=A0ABY4W5T9_9PROT|nr:Dyp-type peroxidase [Sneathiella marina]USG60649.1 Dyp-type peroxidase [Sneathiella marina]
MDNAQSAIFIEGTTQNRFLEFTVKDGVSLDEAKTAIASALTGDLENTMKAPHVVWGFGRSLATSLFGTDTPSDLLDFTAHGSGDNKAEATQRDIFLWIHGSHEDEVFDCARLHYQCLANICNVELEITGFKYKKDHDLIGFEDGTANPKTDEARADAALTKAGGSILLTQKWVHKLDKFESVPTSEQEKIVGRTKYENLELEGDEMPPTSHVSRTDVDIDGVAQKVYRRSAPFGNMREHGLYFVSFAKETQRHDIQLKRMFGETDDGLMDRLTEFSTAATGSYWYIPPAAQLAALRK